ncbi:substrate-binding periplasmic protein [Vibrio aquimaris]|uniref:Bacterial extracellular solute-binding protein, family 3 n=1 Tax=Vibrio aquimaris TaxID=2587862 RepID=A0A5P9CIK7_9VIBR|nr:transporter substrate-binding domain-containing protein [Vibrio aquimaris]QFT26046.1 Bacterial extracellular solute-binding protein, family 3 [Vibrio aquimaris]
MKLLFGSILIFLCLLPSKTWAVSESSTHTNKKVTIYYYDREPLRFKTNSDYVTGILIDINRLVFENANISFDFNKRPFKRIMEELKNPSIKGCISGIYKTSERVNEYWYSDEPLLIEKPFVVVINNEKISEIPKTPTVAEVFTSDLKLGTYSGFSYGAWFDKKMEEYNVNRRDVSYVKDIKLTKSAHLLHLLAEGRVDFVLMPYVEAKWILNHNEGISKYVSIVNVTDSPEQHSRYLVCSKSISTTEAMMINKSLGQTLESTEYKSILDKYY